jgi:glycosyltransferase involved in cell wall biosynthesis
MSLRGHEIIVIDYDIDWRKKSIKTTKKEPAKTATKESTKKPIKEKPNKKIFDKRAVFDNVHKIFSEAKIKVIRPFSLKIPVLEYLSLWLCHKKEIKRQIREFQPDVILGFGIINTYIASKLAKKNNIPFVYYWIDVLHTLIPSKTFQSFGRYLEKTAIKNSSQVITINEKLSDYVLQLGAEKEKISIIGAGIDLDKYNPEIDGSNIRETYGIKKNDNVLFFMGWLYHFSGLKEVAIELAKSNDKSTKLLIVGDGDALEDLQQIKKNYDTYDQIILTGKQPFEKIPEFIASSDVCLLPAYPDEEAMQDIVPIKMYEYLAMEKPVITTHLPGIMKEFGGDSGVVYVDESVDSLVKSKELIDDDITTQFGKKGRTKTERYDWTKITDDFEMTLSHVCME